VSLENKRELVTIMEAAAMARVHRRSIYLWMRDGRLEYVRTAGGSVRIYADTLFRPAGPREPPRGRQP
jgi:excisionase family DNA binding protein